MRTAHQAIKCYEQADRNGVTRREWRDRRTGRLLPEDGGDVPNTHRIRVSYVPKTAMVRLSTTSDELRPFRYYILKNRHTRGTDVIGIVTEHTTEARLESMIYRYCNPGHARACAFHGQVRFSGPRDQGSGDLPTKMPYVLIPRDVEASADLRVDDECLIRISRRDGLSYQCHYHLSQMSLHDVGGIDIRRLIVPLPQLKRLVAVLPDDGEDGGPRYFYVTKRTYDLHTRLISEGRPLTFPWKHRAVRRTKTTEAVDEVLDLPCLRFIDAYDEVEVEIVPEARTVNLLGIPQGRYDFTQDTLRILLPDDERDRYMKALRERGWKNARYMRGAAPRRTEGTGSDGESL